MTVCSEASVGESIEKSKQENEECRLNKEAGNQTESASAGETDVEFSDLSWVGNIIGLKNGDIEVIWADGMVSTVCSFHLLIFSLFCYFLYSVLYIHH
jgi:ubiquitin-conjugating enzyme E2 O